MQQKARSRWITWWYLSICLNGSIGIGFTWGDCLITSPYSSKRYETHQILRICVEWFVASLISLHFVREVLIYFYTIAMMYIGLARCHTDGVRHIMATNGGAPGKAILYHAGANNVAISLLSKQCLWAVAVCSHTITTKYIGALNTSDCCSNSIGYKIVVALLLMLASLNSTTSVGPKLCGISSINAVRLSSGNVFLYYRYQAEWATNRG